MPLATFAALRGIGVCYKRASLPNANSFFSLLPSLTFGEILIRILFAALVGGLIGLERERSHKSAGLRTNALVALGATLLTIVSLNAFKNLPLVDPTRIISNIIVGIGFIGGGAILHEDHRVQGLTTAATLWVVAALGIVIGVGMFKLAISAAAIVYFILTVLWMIERKNNSRLLYQSLKEHQHEQG